MLGRAPAPSRSRVDDDSGDGTFYGFLIRYSGFSPKRYLWARMASVQQIVYVERSTSSSERVADMSRGPARESATIRPVFLQHVSDKHVGSMMIIDGAFGPASIAMMSSLIVTPSTGSH